MSPLPYATFDSILSKYLEINLLLAVGYLVWKSPGFGGKKWAQQQVIRQTMR